MIHQISFRRSIVAGTIGHYETVAYSVPYLISFAGDIVLRDGCVFKVIKGVEIPSAIEVPDKLQVETIGSTDRKVW